jgi:hypothetical protein
MISLMLLLVAILSGCASEKAETDVPVPPVVIEEPKEPEPMSLLLACAPVNSNSALTRLADDVVQLNDNYRLITDVHVIAMKSGAPVNATVDHKQSSELKTDKTQFYHFSYCDMPKLTNNCLVYAKAVDVDKGSLEATSKYNGSLNAVIPNLVQSTDDIRFSLESILNAKEARQVGGEITESDLAEWEKEAWALADALTAVVNDSHNEGNTLVWKTSTNSILRNLFQRFINNDADLPGSAASVKQWMLDLANSADYYITSGLSAIEADEIILLGIIKEKANTAAEAIEVTQTSYPRDINLPDGAAALRWTEVEEGGVKVQKFVPQMQTTTLDNINSVSRFVYPPALYYFVDSDIWTSNSALSFEQYSGKSHWKATSENDANAVQTLFSDGETVLSNTKTVAVADPLQYAVAHLTMEVKASAESLEYGEGSEKTINISNLTLKGVIIGGQRPVDYQFKPISNSQYDVNFVYDSQVNSANTTLKHPSESESGDIYHTLALQSYDGENVNVILEFEYSGNEGFKCHKGYVYPDTRFYLVGEVKLAENALNETDDYKKRVFTQDYTTTIKMTVNSLENAYHVLPSLLSNSLEIGVMITPQWFSATPSGPVVME